MVSFEPVDIDYDKIGDEVYKWDEDEIKDLEVRFNILRRLDETLSESTDDDTIEMTIKTEDALKHDAIELVANQIYDRLTVFSITIEKDLEYKENLSENIEILN